MRKIFFSISLVGLPLLLSAGMAMAGVSADNGMILMEDPHNATFFLYATRPSTVGDDYFDNKAFNKIMAGNDKVVGKDTSGVKMKVDTRTGCFYKVGDKDHLYHQTLLDSSHLPSRVSTDVGDAADWYYNFTPSIAWNKGGQTTDTAFAYDEATGVGLIKCADVRTETSMKGKLTAVGQMGGRGGYNLTVYEPKKPLQSAELKNLYKKAIFPDGQKPKFEDFVKMHPLLYIFDGFGLYHRLFNSTFKPAAEMGKPAVYLYPAKDTAYEVKVAPVGGKVTVSIPSLEGNKWNVVAQPSGQLTVGKGNYDYLFYESTTNRPMPLTEGFVAEKKLVSEALNKALDTIGFRPAEKKEFLAYWLPRMTEKPYYAVQFLFNGELDNYSKVSIAPALPLYRVFMNFQGLAKPTNLPAQKLPTLDRSAPHAFEWGGNNLAK